MKIVGGLTLYDKTGFHERPIGKDITAEEYEKIHRIYGGWSRFLVDKERVTKSPIHFFSKGDNMVCGYKEMLRFGTYKMENVTCLTCRRKLVDRIRQSKSLT